MSVLLSKEGCVVAKRTVRSRTNRGSKTSALLLEIGSLVGIITLAQPFWLQSLVEQVPTQDTIPSEAAIATPNSEIDQQLVTAVGTPVPPLTRLEPMLPTELDGRTATVGVAPLPVENNGLYQRPYQQAQLNRWPVARPLKFRNTAFNGSWTY